MSLIKWILTANSAKKALLARSKSYKDMATKSSIAKQKRREKLVSLKWDKRQELKKIIVDIDKSDEERLAAKITLNKMPRNSSPVRLRNRCQFTGRARGYLRRFKMSRLCFREMANLGLIPGIVKASW
jgi:small subunit ribosomal protein S14